MHSCITKIHTILDKSLFIFKYNIYRQSIYRLLKMIIIDMIALNLFVEFQEYAEDTVASFLVSRLLRGARC